MIENYFHFIYDDISWTKSRINENAQDFLLLTIAHPVKTSSNFYKNIHENSSIFANK